MLEFGGAWGMNVTPVGSGWEGEIARLDGRIDVLAGRIDPLEQWQQKSEVFHMEMRKRWDNFDGAQAAEAKIQRDRHRANTAKINLLMLLVTVLVCIAAWATFFRPSRDHSFLDFHSSNLPQVAQTEQSAHW